MVTAKVMRPQYRDSVVKREVTAEVFYILSYVVRSETGVNTDLPE